MCTEKTNCIISKNIYNFLLQAHFALAKAEEKLASEGRRLVVITQNIDELHRDAGTKNLLELHGLFQSLIHTFFSIYCSIN